MSTVGIGLVILDAEENLDRRTNVLNEFCCWHNGEFSTLLNEFLIRQVLNLYKQKFSCS